MQDNNKLHSTVNSKTNLSGIGKLLLSVIFICSFVKMHAQSNPIQEANAELRRLFSNLTNPNPNVLFLYDMSAHVTDSAFYTHISYDTSSVDNWYLLYSEMYYAAYDTTNLLKSDTIFQHSFPIIQRDTIPIGVMDWRFNRLKPDALTTNNYFDFDTVNHVLYDKNPQPVSPYLIDTIFAASPLVHEVDFANVVFQINPQFLFIDPTFVYSLSPDDKLLKIDFDDGNGWVTVSDINSISNYEVVYPSGGLKIIKVATFTSFNVLVSISTSSLHVRSERVTVAPDYWITDIPELDIGVYEGCIANGSKKYIVYLEGMDFLNDRSVQQIYMDIINNSNLVQLQNFGYSFVIVSWRNTYAKIQENAMAVVRLLDHLKCETDSVAPFVLIGESMGGLIGRYALLYMESPDYQQEDISCKRERLHNTRLFISYDSPHQGANIPLGVQQLYRNLAPITYLGSSYTAGINKKHAELLDGYSSKQMLLYHVENDIMPGVPISISPYGPSIHKILLDNKFAAMGNYPQYCKMVALSNGALDGARQLRPWDNSDRQPNDIMLQFDSETYLKILWFKIAGGNSKLKVRTNPDGNGKVLEMSTGVNRWKLKLKWFGVTLAYESTDLMKIEKSALGVRPYCVSAASNLDINRFIPLDSPRASPPTTNWVRFLGYTIGYTIDGAGNVNFSSSAGGIGFRWFASINYDFHAYTDGIDFGFVPLHSGFDYDAANPSDLDYDIYNDPVADIMQRTPFDAVVTNPWRSNRLHLFMNNPHLQSYETCADEGIMSYLLPREIGDDSLWLENTRTLPHGSVFETERDLMVNYRNPYYNYPSSNSTITRYTHADRDFYIISKEEDVQITAGAIALVANNTVDINPAQPLTGTYQILPGTMIICCTDFRQRPSAEDNYPYVTTESKVSSLLVYPNPLQGHILTVKYRFAKNAPVTAWLYNVQGQVIDNILMPFEDNTLESYFTIDAGKMGLSPGIYILRLSNGTETVTEKIVITR